MNTAPIKNYSLIWMILLFFIFAIMCFFGFRGKDAASANDIQWTTGEPGLHFNNTSFAYTEGLDLGGHSLSGAMQLTFSLKPKTPVRPRLGIILQIYDKTDGSLITVGQWDRSLMVLESNDYSNSRRLPKIYVPLGEYDQQLNISIISDSSGTEVFINDEFIKSNAALILQLPINREKTHLILGNGIEGRTPWAGTLYSLSINDIVYYFNGEKIEDFIIPERIPILVQHILEIPSFFTLFTNSMGRDLFLNFFGFIPLGFLLFLNIAIMGRKGLNPLLLALLIPFLFSLSIELYQVGIVSRDSSLLDLFLNTLGGLTGALFAKKIWTHYKN